MAILPERRERVAPALTPAMTPEAERALVALIEATGEGIAHIARRMGCDVEGAQEVTQETWLTLLRWWPRLYAGVPSARWPAYVTRAAQSRAYDALRAQGRRMRRTTPLVADAGGELEQSGAPSREGESAATLAQSAELEPEAYTEGREAWATLQAACVSDRERLIVALRAMAYAHDDIAYALAEAGFPACTAMAVMQCLARVRLRARAAASGPDAL